MWSFLFLNISSWLFRKEAKEEKIQIETNDKKKQNRIKKKNRGPKSPIFSPSPLRFPIIIHPFLCFSPSLSFSFEPKTPIRNLLSMPSRCESTRFFQAKSPPSLLMVKKEKKEDPSLEISRSATSKGANTFQFPLRFGTQRAPVWNYLTPSKKRTTTGILDIDR
jgi:hypothetical protein